MFTFQGGESNDPFYLKPLQYLWFVDGDKKTQDRTIVYPRLANERTAVIGILGQSNAANWGTGSYTPVNAKVHNLSVYDGGVYAAKEPLLGANGGKAGFGIRLADKLITHNKYDRVILAPFAVGGASVEEWSRTANGTLNHRIGVFKRRLDSQGLAATHILWHQGETDYSLGTTQAAYTARLMEVIQTFRDLGINCPFYVAKASWTNGSVSAAVIAAQGAVVSPGNNIYAGPNTDTIGLVYRDAEGTHMLATGLALHADMWYDSIVAVEG